MKHALRNLVPFNALARMVFKRCRVEHSLHRFKAAARLSAAELDFVCFVGENGSLPSQNTEAVTRVPVSGGC